MADFGTDIRTIAHTREIEEKLAALRSAFNAEKAAIDGRRAIAYAAAYGATSVVSGAKNSTIPPGTSKAVDAAVEAAKKVLDGNTWQTSTTTAPGKDSKGTDMSSNAYSYLAGSTTAKDLLDATQTIVDGSIASASSDISEPNGYGGGIAGSDKITGIFAEDAITGFPFLMALDGMYRLPDGWVDPFTPPVYEYFVLGKYYRVLAYANGTDPNTDYDSPSPSQAAQSFLAAANAYNAGPGSGKPWTLDGVHSVTTTSWSFDIRTSSNTPITFNGSVLNCTIQGEAICPAEAPQSMDTWPAVGNYILALTGGLWTPSPFDSEVPFHMQGTQSAVPFAMDGGRFGIMEPAIGGGQLLYEVSSGTPYTTPDQRLENAINTAIYFRPDGTIGHFIPAEQIVHWLPKQR